MNYQNIGKRNTEPSVLRKIESNHTNVVTQEFLLVIFLPARNKVLTFIQTKDFQYQKENDQECTVRNPALKSLGR